MGQAVFYGVVASSPLILGAFLGLRFRLPERLLASVLAFASGALITALAFELFEDSYEQGGLWRDAARRSLAGASFVALCCSARAPVDWRCSRPSLSRTSRSRWSAAPRCGRRAAQRRSYWGRGPGRGCCS